MSKLRFKMGKPKIPPVPPGLTTEAKKERKRYESRQRSYLKKIRAVSLSIMVWGPAPGSPVSPKVAKKRKDILDALIARGYNAMFSEDFKNLDTDLSEWSKEFAQAKAVHLIIILIEGAPGATAELHDSFAQPDLIPNIFCLLPKRYKGGYSAKSVVRLLEDGYGGVCWYQDSDIDKCNVLTRAIKRADARREVRAKRKLGSESMP